MQVMNINTLDLNLLRVFDALMSERNVSVAGSRLGLSQPAMNRSTCARCCVHSGSAISNPRLSGAMPLALRQEATCCGKRGSSRVEIEMLRLKLVGSMLQDERFEPSQDRSRCRARLSIAAGARLESRCGMRGRTS